VSASVAMQRLQTSETTSFLRTEPRDAKEERCMNQRSYRPLAEGASFRALPPNARARKQIPVLWRVGHASTEVPRQQP